MVEWHHQLDGHKFEQALGDGEEQGSLVYCIPWGCKESDTTDQLNNNNRNKYRDSLVAQLVKNPPAMWETWVRSLSRADPLEEGMATHSRILAWRIPWTKEP